MALEDLTGTKYIDDLVSTNPTATDVESEGDDHIRGIKNVLKTTFPNVTGAVTTTHTEINNLSGLTEIDLLSSQEGALFLKGMVAASGTANALVGDFTPDITLTDKVTVVVEASAANTSTTVTFAPDGLTAKNIKKHGNQSLDLGDIFGAGHKLILSYDSGNDVWELLNPATTTSDTSVIYDGSDQSITNALDEAIAFDSELYDDLSFHDVSTNNERFTIPAGVNKVILRAQVEFASNATGYRAAYIHKNGGGVFNGGPSVRVAAVNGAATILNLTSAPVKVIQNDFFEVYVHQTSTGALNVSGGAAKTWFSIEVVE